MQLFILLYIEGGSYISEDEELWEFVILYVIPISVILLTNQGEQDMKNVSAEVRQM